MPSGGVPVSSPVAGVKAIPLGSVPDIESIGGGVPIALTMNEPDAPTVKPVLLRLVNTGGIEPSVGVTLAGNEVLLPIALLALTVQEYGIMLVKPVTMIGVAGPLIKILPGLQVAR